MTGRKEIESIPQRTRPEHDPLHLHVNIESGNKIQVVPEKLNPHRTILSESNKGFFLAQLKTVR